MSRLPATTRIALSVAGALLGLALSIPVFRWLHSTFEFMR